MFHKIVKLKIIYQKFGKLIRKTGQLRNEDEKYQKYKRGGQHFMNATIKGAVIGAIITGVLSIAGTVAATAMAKDQGEQETINQLNSQIANVNGDNNTVTINSVDDLINEYKELTAENKLLVSQNTEYSNELEETKSRLAEYENQADSKVQELEQQLNDKPDVQFRNIGLSIEGEDIPINAVDSSVIIHNRTYYSEEFIKSLIGSDTNLSVQDDRMYVGKIIKEKSYLSDEWVLDSRHTVSLNSVTDSYGNVHTNALIFDGGQCSIIYNLNGEYSLLKCNIAIRDNADMERTGVLTIKADDTVVYTSPVLTKTTAPFSETDIPISNCSLLTIEYNASSSYNDCILDEIVIYN